MARNTNMAFFAAVVAAALLMSLASAATTYQVGDGLGWSIPSGGAAAYTTWADNKTFTVGDTLVFTYSSGNHDVAEVTKAAFDACNATNPITLETASPTNITLSSSGEHYYICTFSGHCSAGQKLSISVTGASSPAPAPRTTPPPSPSPPASVPAPAPSTISPPPSPPASVPAPAPSTSTPTPAASPAPTPSSSRAPVTWTVGNNSGWTVLPPGSYQTWAANKTFVVGDTLVFNYSNGTHDVAVVTKANYDSCNTSSTLALFTNPPTRITLNSTGENFFICTFTGHCAGGQKLAINVTSGSTTATPPSSTATPPSSSATPPGSSANPPPGSPTSPNTPSSPTPEGSAPPPPNTAASLGAAGLSATFLSIALALLS
ncbi:uclacyanin-3-like [Malus sylvestris]|uniref:uclacyanin-3-like n=1 Tax=Malus sylvestris TaxID=3752 RepID=UPI0021AC4ACC|nr:uclacyanin-3-like [Malus sylvestris]